MKFYKSLFVVIVVTVVSLGWGTISHAQSGHFSAASLSMGGTGTAYLDTYHANFVNPANLMLNGDTKPSTSIGLLGGLSGTAGGPLLNISAYNNHFTSGNLVDVETALNDWFGTAASNSKRMGMEVGVVPIAGSWRGENMAFSLALRNRVLLNGSMNRGYAEVLLSGVTQERFATPKPVNFSSEAVAYSEISAGFSYKLIELPNLLGFGKDVKVYGGIAPKYIIPHTTSSIDFNSTLQVSNNEIVHDFEYTFQTVGGLTSQFRDFYEANQSDNFDGSIGDFVEPEGNDFTEVEGSGFGVDLGGTIEMKLTGAAEKAFSWIGGEKRLSVGLSVVDLGSISYTNGGSFTANETFTWDGVDIDDGFDEALTDSIANQIYLNFEPEGSEEVTKKLPTKINMGGHLQLGKLAFALDLTKGVNDAGMNSKRLALGIGTEYKLLNVIPLRVGYRTGGLTSSSITFGTGIELRNFEFTVAGLTVPNSENRGSGIGGAWSGLVFRF